MNENRVELGARDRAPALHDARACSETGTKGALDQRRNKPLVQGGWLEVGQWTWTRNEHKQHRSDARRRVSNRMHMGVCIHVGCQATGWRGGQWTLGVRGVRFESKE